MPIVTDPLLREQETESSGHVSDCFDTTVPDLGT